MSKKKNENTEDHQSLEASLLALAKPKMSPKELLKAARKAHPDASKKEIVRAAFRSLIASSATDHETAQTLHDFAMTERGADEA
ncbi:MAG: hypothetical protein ABIQ30_06975 [Devosia sp.]